MISGAILKNIGVDVMPQMNMGGKFIFGESVIGEKGSVQIPPQAIDEYRITSEGRVYLFTGSKITGGFCVTRKGLLLPSKLGHILTETPALLNYTSGDGEFIKYKGRYYCRTGISVDGKITLTEEMADFLNLHSGSLLLSIRSSDIAFTMGAKGTLLKLSSTLLSLKRWRYMRATYRYINAAAGFAKIRKTAAVKHLPSIHNRP